MTTTPNVVVGASRQVLFSGLTSKSVTYLLLMWKCQDMKILGKWRLFSIFNLKLLKGMTATFKTRAVKELTFFTEERGSCDDLTTTWCLASKWMFFLQSSMPNDEMHVLWPTFTIPITQSFHPNSSSTSPYR